MKHIYIIFLSALMLLSCNADDEFVISRNPLVPNIEPTTPSLVFPTNNLVCTNFNLQFDWNASRDINGDALSYVIEVATDINFTTILFTAITSQTTHPFTLEKGVAYYWRVKARDTEGKESIYSATQTFFTEPEAGINNIPFVPTVVSPLVRATVTGPNITLDWDAADADNDPLSYDLYFGDTNPPELFVENSTSSSLDVNVLTNTEYYWRVVAKDNKQGVTIGQVWSFTTD
ncbi:fibronectin type III domain-containing protein [Aquimarina mytili]|uniref:Fibronectin type-III domain-containing protein n=1 Tax=Aquimarina mytili TaxID=874423 RepID=A0A936ZUA3_9FLAO|nr:hypothetical protein [Aquimarina mytili]MBL0685694.1 hypothetical protein [Aquimarina mytili]